MKRFPIFFAAALMTRLALCLGGCSSSKKLVTTTPPMELHLPDTLPALPVSEINLPLRVCVRPLLARADSIMPREFISYGWPAYQQPTCDFRYKYRFLRSGFTMNCVNNKINLQLTCSYQVAGSRCICALGKPVSPWISGTCGFGSESLRRVDIGINSQLDFLPNYRIRTRTVPEHLKAMDKCIVSMFSQDMTQQIVDSVHASIVALCANIDQNIASLDFPGWLRQTTAAVGQGMAIGRYGWLALNPSQIRVGQLNDTHDTLDIAIGISCKPLLSSDSSKKSVIPPLPPLSITNNREGILLYLPASYEYTFISRLLNDTLQGRTFIIKGNTVIIRDVQVKGIGNHQIEMKIDFSGSRKGRIYFRGTPVLDSAKQALSLPDISYSLESKDLGLRIAKSLLRGKIRKSLKGNSYLDLAALLRANLPALSAVLNRPLAPMVATAGKIREIRLLGLLAGDKALQIQLFVNADLSIICSGLPK